MLNHNSSRIFQSQMIELLSTVASIEEGSALVITMEGGKAKVGPSAGTAGEQCAGIARSQLLNPSVATKVETITVPSGAPYTVTLAKTPLTPATRVGAVFVAGGAALTYGVPAAGVFGLSGTTITFHSADAGKQVRVTYAYNLTVVEAQLLYGQGIGDAAQSVVGAVDAITSAQVVYTNKFDPAANWAAGGPVKLGANGEFTLSGDGSVVETCYVIDAPSAANDGFLGLYFSI